VKRADLGRNVDSLVDLLRARTLEAPDWTACLFLLDGEVEQARLTYAGLAREKSGVCPSNRAGLRTIPKRRRKDMWTLRGWWLMLAAGFALAIPSMGQGATCQERCAPPPVAKGPRVVIDANNGGVIDGETRFPGNSQIEVVLVNKNPYKYSYKVAVDEHSIELDLIGKALQGLGILDADNKLPTPGAPVPPPPPPPLNPAAATCGSLESVFAHAEQAADTAQNAHNAVVRRINTLKADAKEFNNFLASVQTDPTEATCADRCAKADAVRPGLDRLADAKALKDLLDAVDAAVKSLADDVAVLEQGRGLMSSACTARLNELVDRLKAANNDRSLVRDAVAALPDLTKKAAAAGELLDAIAADPGAFVSVRYLPARLEATEFTVTITRKDRETGTESAATVTLREGRSRFSISGGIGVGFIGQRTFARRSALVPDGSGGTKVGNVFAVDQESKETLGPALQLNGMFGAKGPVGFGWSLGLTTQQGAKASDLGYYTGPSLTAIGDNLLFTLAYYRQSIDVLGGGFHEGDPVPESLQDPLPTTTKTKSGFLFVVSYRIK
jgi:hypothetical protein